MRAPLLVVLALLVLLGSAMSAAAQATPGAPPPRIPAQAAPVSGERPLRRIEVAVAGGFMGAAPLGDVTATLRPGTGATPFRLFATETRLAEAPFVELRVGTALLRRLEIELRGIFGRPELRTSVTDDAESAPALTVVERIDQYVVEGAVLFMLDELRLGRVVPFASGGGGYLRQLHEGALVVDEGHLYHVGGGIKYWLFTRPRGALRAAGLRADGRLYLLDGGFAFEEGRRRHLGASGGFFVVF